jgi:hypothetical protein
MINVILHIAGEEPITGEVEELPGVSDTMIKVSHPHRLDGKDLAYLAENVTIVYWPLNRLNFIEVLPSQDEEEIIGFVRE